MARQRLIKLDHKPLLILALGAVIVMVLVWQAVRPPGLLKTDDSNQSMGLAKWVQGTPQRKGVDDINWQSIGPGTELRAGDLIFSDTGSSLRFDGLGSLSAEWSEKTLAQAQRIEVPGPDMIRFLLSSGELFLRLQDQQQVQLAVFDGHFYTLKAEGLTHFSWRRDQVDSEFSELVVTSGRLVTGAGALLEVDAGQAIRIPRVTTSALNLQIVRDDLALLSPAPGLRIWLDPDSNLRLSWRRPSTAPTDLEIVAAKDRDFTQGIWTHSIGSDINSAEVPAKDLLVGPIWFQMRSKSDPKIRTSAQLVFLYPDLPSIPDTPADGSELSFTTAQGEKSTEVSFGWTDRIGSVFWRLQLARDGEFKDLVQDVDGLTSPTARVTELGPGSYHWRVLGYHIDRREPIWSRTSRFTIKPVDSIEANAPLTSATPAESTVPEALTVSPPALESIRDPILDPKAKAPVEVRLRWQQAGSKPPGFEVQWSNSATFVPVRSFYTRDETFTIRIRQAGQYYARVRAVDAQFKPLSDFSRTRRVTTRTPAPKARSGIAPLGEPRPDRQTKWQALSPEPNGLLVINEVGQPQFEFKWSSPAASSVWYQLEIARDADFAEIIFRGTAPSASLSVREPLPEGRLYWRVRQGIRGKWGPTWRFEILTE